MGAAVSNLAHELARAGRPASEDQAPAVGHHRGWMTALLRLLLYLCRLCRLCRRRRLCASGIPRVCENERCADVDRCHGHDHDPSDGKKACHGGRAGTYGLDVR